MQFHRYLSFISFFFITLQYAVAQEAAVSGRIIDDENQEVLEKATIQLYKLSKSSSNRKNTNTQEHQDTTFVGGSLSDERGLFSFHDISNGNYLLKINYLGYESKAVNLNKTSKPIALGDIRLKADAVLLDEAVITANVPKMVIKDDTIVYNADAFRVPEGSVIEALVEALPGAKVDDDGGITVNGKTVRRFKMDGRDFMTGNNSAVMKNLPSYVIDQVKAYDEKSDQSRLTGIDDGNDDFVLEFVTKRSARNGLQMNPDIGIGTDHRYGIRLTAMKPFGAMRYTFMGNANNVNDRNFSGRGGRGRGNGNGQRHSKSTALDISYENNKNLKINGRVTWNHNNADNWNRTSSETFVSTRNGAFSHSINQQYSRSNSWTGNMNLQWTIDTLTTLSFRPNLSLSTNDNKGHTNSASFNADPFKYTEFPLEKEGEALLNAENVIMNSRKNKSMSYGDNKDISTQAQLFRRLSKTGRNISLNTNLSYRKGLNRSSNLSFVHLFQQKNKEGNDSTYQTNRYNYSPSNSFNASFGVTYTEPLLIFKPKEQQEVTEFPGDRRMNQRRQGLQGIFLQTRYNYRHSYQKSDPSTYDFPDLDEEAFYNVLNEYRDWTRLFGFLDNPYESYLSDSLSRYSERTENEHNIDLQLRVVREKLNMNVGMTIQPQNSHFIQQYLGRPVDTVRTVCNVSPTLNLRYRFNQQTNLQVTFRGSTSQPSITQLLEIYDNTNPLSITMGNPGLKPSFNSNLSANFQKQRSPKFVTDSLGFNIPKNQRHWSFSTNASWQRTTNAIGNVVTYNSTTGGRITRPENINGNWSANGGMTFNIGLDTLNRWDVSGSLRGSYNHHIAYVNLNRTETPDRNVTHTYNLSPSVSLSFRNKWLNFSLNGNATYAHTENRLQASNNLSTWNYSFGGNTRITFPWGTDLSTDMHLYSKRGYSDKTLNTNELIWNAQLSQSFLKGKKLTIMLQWYDILNKQSNFSRTVNANGWTDREVNAITSYAMIHVSYRYNMFGGRNRSGGNGRGEFFQGGSRGDRPFPDGGQRGGGGGGQRGGGGRFGGF